MVLIGGCRNNEDAARVDSLRELAKELGISVCKMLLLTFTNLNVIYIYSSSQDSIKFIINASYPTMLSWQARASIGLSTMVDEHFGINVVEFMACFIYPRQ